MSKIVLPLRSIWARAYVRIVGGNRELSWMLSEVLLPMISLSAYIFIYRSLGAPRIYEGLVVLGGAMIPFWIGVLWSMASQFYWEKEMGNLDLYMASPMHPVALLLGMALGGMFMSFVRSFFVLLLGVFVFRVELTVQQPLLLALLVILLTRKPHFTYTSETTLYTGIATGVGVEMQKSINFFATNTAFDNLINVIKSRQTQQEVGIRLFAMHLMLEGYNPKFISKESYAKFRQLTPPSIYKLVEKTPRTGNTGVIRPSAVTTASPKQEPRAKENYEQYFHTVKPGETLYGIAGKFKLQVDELRGMKNRT